MTETNVRGLLFGLPQHKRNPCQVCFLATKMSGETPSDNYNSFQEFLDEHQYSRAGVRRYEWIFGETFISSGGLQTTKVCFTSIFSVPLVFIMMRAVHGANLQTPHRS